MRIRYRRPPDREEVFHQTLVHESDDALVTLMPAAGVPRPLVVAGRTVLEPGSPVVWFTFPGARHDIGRFHTARGRFTGYYANILTPVDLDAPAPPAGTPAVGAPTVGAPADEPDDGARPVGDIWLTTDLFLDIFLAPDGPVHVLDRDELEQAVARGWVDAGTAREAEREADRLVDAARRGAWPPEVVDRWPLARARAAAGPAGY